VDRVKRRGVRGVDLVRVRVNSESLVAILKGPELDADLKRRAQNVCDDLPTDNGEEWEVVRLVGDRVSYLVRAANYEARLRAATDPVLQRSLGAGRA
jgi:hypothetical protein